MYKNFWKKILAQGFYTSDFLEKNSGCTRST